jgi:hypothetical protein
MPDNLLQEYQDSPAERADLLAFLKRPGGLVPAQGTWEERTKHWWDDNPHADLHPCRGRMHRHEGGVVGFAGSIPAAYALDGRQLPVLLATTLEVLPEYPKVGLAMLLKMRSLSEEIPIIHTTPSPKLQHTLLKMDARAETHVQRRFFLTGTLAKLSRWPRLDAAMTLTTRIEDVLAISRPYQKADRLEKWHSPESLRWQLSTPTRQQAFVGAIDASGTLHSFLILTPQRVRRLPAWDILEAFTTRDDFSELHALAGAVVRQPGLLPSRASLITTASFPGDPTWASSPALLTREQQVCHYFMLPEALRAVPKHTVMAEGDFVV